MQTVVAVNLFKIDSFSLIWKQVFTKKRVISEDMFPFLDTVSESRFVSLAILIILTTSISTIVTMEDLNTMVDEQRNEKSSEERVLTRLFHDAVVNMDGDHNRSTFCINLSIFSRIIC